MTAFWQGCLFYVDLPDLERRQPPALPLPDSQQEIRRIIVLHGGRLVEDASQATHVILRHRQQSVFQDLSTKGPSNRPKIVSLIWLLACLQERSLIDPAEWGSKAHPFLATLHTLQSVVFTPFPGAGIPDADSVVTASITGLTQATRSIAIALLRCAGFNASTAMNAGKTTHLLAAELEEELPASTHGKLSKLGVARQRGIAIVGIPWLLACLLRWQVVDADVYTAADFEMPIVQCLELEARLLVPESDEEDELVMSSSQELFVEESQPLDEDAGTTGSQLNLSARHSSGFPGEISAAGLQEFQPPQRLSLTKETDAGAVTSGVDQGQPSVAGNAEQQGQPERSGAPSAHARAAYPPKSQAGLLEEEHEIPPGHEERTISNESPKQGPHLERGSIGAHMHNSNSKPSGDATGSAMEGVVPTPGPSVFSQIQEFFERPVEKGQQPPEPANEAAQYSDSMDQMDQGAEQEAPAAETVAKESTKRQDAPSPEEPSSKKSRQTAVKSGRVAAVDKPVVALSGFHTDDQAEMVAALRRLRCSALPGNSSHHWNPRVTHVVAPRLLRTSKVLAGLAAGNWVVSRDWLTESVKGGHCINPAPYELNTIDGFAVAKFWREFRQEHQLRALEGLEVALGPLSSPGPSKADLRWIIVAGGGSICGIDKCHALITSKSTSHQGACRDIPVVLPERIFSWLLSPSEMLVQSKGCEINVRSIVELFLQNSR